MISHEEALMQCAALATAAAESPVRQLRYELRKRAREWSRACEYLDDADEGEAAIELIGSITSGMYAFRGAADEPEDQWAYVVRVLMRDNQASLHLEDAMGRPIYQNYYGPSSPVVVKA